MVNDVKYDHKWVNMAKKEGFNLDYFNWYILGDLVIFIVVAHDRLLDNV